MSSKSFPRVKIEERLGLGGLRGANTLLTIATVPGQDGEVAVFHGGPASSEAVALHFHGDPGIAGNCKTLEGQARLAAIESATAPSRAAWEEVETILVDIEDRLGPGDDAVLGSMLSRLRAIVLEQVPGLALDPARLCRALEAAIEVASRAGEGERVRRERAVLHAAQVALGQPALAEVKPFDMPPPASNRKIDEKVRDEIARELGRQHPSRGPDMSFEMHCPPVEGDSA